MLAGVCVWGTSLFHEVTAADGHHVSRNSEVECPVTGLSVGVHAGKPQPVTTHTHTQSCMNTHFHWHLTHTYGLWQRLMAVYYTTYV